MAAADDITAAARDLHDYLSKLLGPPGSKLSVSGDDIFVAGFTDRLELLRQALKKSSRNDF